MCTLHPSPASWDYTRCEGTPECPPRCPRFVDGEGTPMLVRPYTPTDYDRLLELYETFDSSHCAQGLPPTTPARLEGWVESLLEVGCNFVAVLDGRVVGHSLYTPTSHTEPELAVFVHQEFHGRGIGTELCKHVVASAAASGHDALVLDVERRNRAGVSLYRSLGFEPIGDHRRELHMRLALSEPVASQVQRPPVADA